VALRAACIAMILSWALVPGRSWAPPMEGSQMTYVLVLAAVLNGYPTLIAHTTKGQMTSFQNRASCEQVLSDVRPQIDSRAGAKFACMTQEAWDAIPEGFDEWPPAFRGVGV
jgi:hypothetical protein